MGKKEKLQTRESSSVVLALLFVEFALLLGCCILVLLVLADQIVHVTFGFGKFHLVHTFSRVPVQECFAPEHGREVLSHPLEHFLNCSTVSSEGNRHFQSLCPC